MAHQPMSRPDPPDPPESDEPLFALPLDERATDVIRLASKLAEHVGGAGSHDLALDLVLHEIVEQTRLATMATGAAIALFRGEEMVCRATSGISAPDLGVRLNTRTGLSGACVRTQQVQRCDDTQNDPRVDSAALRNLDVRSILVVPILNLGKLVGIIEILSPRVRAFGERDVLTLEALSRRIVQNLESAAQAAEPVAATTVANEVETPRVIETLPARRDYWTTALTALVIGLAVLLGWMVGYSGWQKTREARVTSMPRPAASPPSAAAPSPAKSPPAEAPRPAEKAASSNRNLATSTNAGPEPGGLVVYKNGKVVFTLPPEATAASEVKTAGRSDAAPVRIAPEVAATYLRYRVEPQYPAAAQQAEALGPVIVEVQVGKDGTVQQAGLVSGDPLLADAALAAVRQWKYEPYSPEGTPVDFSTQVTVNFKGQ